MYLYVNVRIIHVVKRDQDTSSKTTRRHKIRLNPYLFVYVGPHLNQPIQALWVSSKSSNVGWCLSKTCCTGIYRSSSSY